MNVRTLTQGFLAAAVALTVSSGAFADDTIKHQQNTDRYGTAATEMKTSRVIKLDGKSKVLNVTRGENVTIEKDGKSFKWNFNTFDTSTFDLAQIAPKDFGAGAIKVYVARNADEKS